MITDEIVTYDQLVALSGFNNPAQVAAWCENNKIVYFYASKHRRPATTSTALNSALGLLDNTSKKTSFEVY